MPHRGAHDGGQQPVGERGAHRCRGRSRVPRSATDGTSSPMCFASVAGAGSPGRRRPRAAGGGPAWVRRRGPSCGNPSVSCPSAAGRTW
jgi:hypothetical protein